MILFIKKAAGRLRIRFQPSLLMIIFIILGISTFSTLFAVLSINKSVSTKNAQQLFSDNIKLIENKLNQQMENAVQLTNLAGSLPDFRPGLPSGGVDHPLLPFMIEAIEGESYLYSIYTGNRDGDFLQLIKTSSEKMIIAAHDAPENTSYILRTIGTSGGSRNENWRFLDDGLNVVLDRTIAEPEYNPAVRPWFRLSMQNPGETLLTSPYVFNSLKKPGLTASCSTDIETAIGVDITLAGLRTYIDGISISGGTGIMILDEADRILAANSVMEKNLEIPEEPLFPVSETDEAVFRAFFTDNKMLARQSPWEVPGGRTFKLIITAPLSDFLSHQKIIQTRVIIISMIIFILAVPAIVFSSRSLSSFLEKLAADAGKIQHFDFSGELPEHSPVIEFDELALAFRVMKKTLAQKTTALETALQKLERIIELGIAMSVEQDSDKLLELILRGAREISHADGGSLYLKNEDDVLEFKIVLNDSLGFEQGGTSSSPVSMPGVPMWEADGSPNYHNVVSYACHVCRRVVIEDAYEEPDFDFSGTEKFDRMNKYRSKSFLTVPLKLQGGDVIGAIQLINCLEDDSREPVPFSPDIQGFVEALSAEAAAVLHNRNLMYVQDKLFESLIQLTAGAIDTKSPYTGGHCERVPKLAMMLADEAENSREGALADFRFQTDEERRAFKMGAWLHDAGKMTTPEFVVDKAVKLETIYNRIHEIRTRFEVILRDIRLEEKDKLIAGINPEEASKIRETREAELFDDFGFIARCNTGDFNPDPEWKSRLKEISQRTWFSHFDHTAGLSREELSRMEEAYIPGRSLIRRLLSDNPEHLVPYKKDFVKTYEKYGFKLPHPEYLYNRGELYNLAIERGTLSEEERYKINEHIMQTIVMLDQLPFPKELSPIMEFVGTHHETLSGSGYPRGLTEKELSIPSRILTIADIFEALTACDRPYKDAKTLSEAISILYKLKESRQIDSDLFELFLRSGIYIRYAEKYLLDSQMDDVDIDRYLDEPDFAPAGL